MPQETIVFAFSRKERVQIAETGLFGRVKGFNVNEAGGAMYFVRYLLPDDDTGEAWFAAEALRSAPTP